MKGTLAEINKYNEVECVVVECEPTYEYYTVTVEDMNGDQWSYYDDDEYEIGTEIMIGFNNESIVDVDKGEN